MNFFLSLHQFADVALLILRLSVGCIFLFHGLPKRGLWSAQPSAQMPAAMITKLRILSIVEPAGALGLIFGFLTQAAAIGLVIVMSGAIQFLVSKVHRKFKEEHTAGWEFEFLLLVSALVLAILGGGKYALDRAVFGI